MTPTKGNAKTGVVAAADSPRAGRRRAQKRLSKAFYAAERRRRSARVEDPVVQRNRELARWIGRVQRYGDDT